MNEEIKKAILEEEQLLEILLAIHLNNISITNEEEADEDEIERGIAFNLEEYKAGSFKKRFRSINTLDLADNIETLRKWKNSNALDLLNEAIERNPKEATEENIEEAKASYEAIAEAQRELYKEEVKFLEKYIDDDFLNNAFLVVYKNVLSGSYALTFNFTRLFYMIKKYAETPIAETLRHFLKAVIEEKEVNYTNKDIKLEDGDGYFIKLGLTISELVYNASKEGIFTDKMQDYYNYRKTNILDDVGGIDPKEKVANYLYIIGDLLRIDDLFLSSVSNLDYEIEETLEENNLSVKETLAGDEEKLIDLAFKNYGKLEEITLENKERTKDFKNEAVKTLVSIFSLEEETESLTKKSKEEIRKESYLSFNDLEPVGKEWTKTNVSEYNTAFMNLHSKIASYNDNNLEAKERKLNTIKYKMKQLEAKNRLTEEERDTLADLEVELDEIEKDIKETKERLTDLEIKIKEEEDLLKETTKELNELNELSLTHREKLKETRKLKRKIKELITSITMLKKARDSRGLYLQLAQDDGKTLITATEETTGGDVILYLDNNIDITNHFTREATTFLRYLQGKAYNLPFEVYKNQDKPILIDLDDYIVETGRSPSNYVRVRNQLEEAIDLIQKEYYRIDGKANKYNLDIKGKIELIGDYFLIKPSEVIKDVENTTTKTTFLVYLGSTYKKILFNEKVLQWASIPKLLMRLTDKEIKQKGYTYTKLEVVQDLGFYLYETLRKNLNKEGYYKRTFTIKVLVDLLTKSGALATNKTNTYNRRIIEPLEDALNFLQEELKLISYSTKAFTIYAGNEELEEKGLAGSKEPVIKRAFEEAKITITFKVYDKENYDNIKNENMKHQKKAKRIKASKENLEQLSLIEDANFIEK